MRQCWRAVESVSYDFADVIFAKDKKDLQLIFSISAEISINAQECNFVFLVLKRPFELIVRLFGRRSKYTSPLLIFFD